MTPTELASALRDVEIANEEENYAKFQSDCAIRDDAAKALESMTIECKDLEWGGMNAHGVSQAYGISRMYWYNNHNGRCYLRHSHWNTKEPYKNIDSYGTEEQAQAAANEHNKQQFQQIIEEWRKG